MEETIVRSDFVQTGSRSVIATVLIAIALLFCLSVVIEMSENYEATAAEPCVGEEFSIDGLRYRVFSDHPFAAELSGYDGISKRLVVPDSVSYKGMELPVLSIGKEAFYGCASITSADLGNVSEVGVKAFANCTKLKTVDVGESMKTVSAYAFYRCVRLADIGLEDSAKTMRDIGSYAFYKCSSLSSVAISSYLNTLGVNAFSLSFVDEKHSALEYGLESLKGYMYENDGGKLVRQTGPELGKDIPYGRLLYRVVTTLPAELEVVGHDSSFRNLTVPESLNIDGFDFHVTSIGEAAFKGYAKIRTFCMPGIEKIGKEAFYGCTYVKPAELDSIKSIGVKAFAKCTNIGPVSFGDSLKKIGSYAFYACKSLESVDVPSSVTSIGAYAFYKCYSLEDASLGDSLKKIGSRAFSKTALEEIRLPSSVNTIGSYAFYGCAQLRCADMDCCSASIGAFAFGSCCALEHISMPEVIRKIGSNAFDGITFKDEKGATIGHSAASLSSRTFEGTGGVLSKCASVEDLAENKDADVVYSFEIVGDFESSKAGHKCIGVRIAIKNAAYSEGYSPNPNYYDLVCSDGNAYSYYWGYSTDMGDVTLGEGSSKVFSIGYEVAAELRPAYIAFNGTQYKFSVGYDSDLAITDGYGETAALPEEPSADVTYNFRTAGTTISSKEGYKVVLFEVAISNNSFAEGFSPNPNYFDVACSDGNWYSYYWGYSTDMSDVTLGEGSCKLFAIGYEIPEELDAEHLKFVGSHYGYTVGYDSGLEMRNVNGEVPPIVEEPGADISYSFSVVGTSAHSDARYVVAVCNMTIANNHYAKGFSPNPNYFDLVCSDGNAYSYYWGYSTDMSDVTLGVGSSKAFSIGYRIPAGLEPEYIAYVGSVYDRSVGYDPELDPNGSSSGGEGLSEFPDADVTYNFLLKEVSDSSKHGYRIALLEVVMSNNSYIEGFSPNPNYFDLVCSDGNSYSYYWGVSTDMSDVTLGVGASKVFAIGYEIPAGLDPEYIRYVGSQFRYTAGYDSGLEMADKFGEVPSLIENPGADITYGFSFSGTMASSDAGKVVVVLSLTIRNGSYSEGFSPNPNYFDLVCSDGNAYSYYWGVSTEMSNVSLGEGSTKTFTIGYEIPASLAPEHVRFVGSQYSYTVGYDPSL